MVCHHVPSLPSDHITLCIVDHYFIKELIEYVGFII